VISSLIHAKEGFVKQNAVTVKRRIYIMLQLSQLFKHLVHLVLELLFCVFYLSHTVELNCQSACLCKSLTMTRSFRIFRNRSKRLRSSFFRVIFSDVISSREDDLSCSSPDRSCISCLTLMYFARSSLFNLVRIERGAGFL
jgi:hypothetical protein